MIGTYPPIDARTAPWSFVTTLTNDPVLIIVKEALLLPTAARVAIARI